MPITTIANAKIGIHSSSTCKPGEDRAFFTIDLPAFRDPYGRIDLRKLDGRDPTVQEFVKADPRLPGILFATRLIVHDAIVTQKSTWVSLNFTDPRGKWIAPAVAEIVAADLSQRGFSVAIFHHAF